MSTNLLIEVIAIVGTVLGLFGGKVVIDRRRYNVSNTPQDITISQALLVKKVILPDLERTLDAQVAPLKAAVETQGGKVDAQGKSIKCLEEKTLAMMAICKTRNPDLYNLRMDPEHERKRRARRGT